MEVAHLRGVALEVVELKLLRGGEVMNVLVALGAHAATGPHLLVARILVVLVQPVGAPGCIRVGRESHEGLALEVRWRLDADEVEQRRCDVEIEGHPLRARSGPDAWRIADHQRDSDRGLVHQSLVVEAVLTKEKAVIRAPYDDRVIEQRLLFEHRQHLPDVLVIGLDPAIMVLHQLLERARRIALQELGPDLVERLDDPAGLPRVTRQVFVETHRLRDRYTVELVHHAQRPVERCVGRVEPKEQTKRCLAPLREPGHGIARQKIIDVLVVLAWRAELPPESLDDHRIEVVRLTGESEVVVPVMIHEGAFNMGLADEGDLVARVTDEVRDDGEAPRNLAVLIVDRPGRVRVEAAQYRGASRQAQRIDAEGILEYGAIAPDAVDVGSFQQLVAGQRGLVPACPLAEKENEVRASRGRSASESRGQQRRRKRGGASGARGSQEIAARTGPHPLSRNPAAS